MNKNLIKEVILEQKSARENFDLGIKRALLGLIGQYVPLPHTLVISGIRRVGKSTLLAQIMDSFYKQGSYYFNFEDERLIGFKLSDFNLLYETLLEVYGERKVFFFDEIQNVPKWEIFVRRMQDKGHKFFITGSNASLLSKELSTKLTGRVLSLELYPFSFREFLAFKGFFPDKQALYNTTERGKIKRYFNQYLIKGGMPEYLKYNDTSLLKHVYEDILYRDIVARYEIKQIKALRELGLYFLSNTAGLFSYNGLKRFLQLGSVNTAKSYAGYLENSFLISTLNRFSYSLKQQFIANKKVYCIDSGLAAAVAFAFSKNRGKFLENLVFLELKRRFQEVYYYKTAANLEVDFLIRDKGQKKSLIQVTQSLADEKTRDREIKALISALKELNGKSAVILSEDDEERIKIAGKTITVVPIYKWLL